MNLAALAALRGIVVSSLAEGDVGAGTNLGLGAITTVERLAGDDPVDLCQTGNDD
jgi:hypothetical protein